MKNILAIHDISCVGRCSLTVALPIISGYGVECRNLPTALLSTHTGGFTGFTCLDLTDEMRKIIDAWEPLKLQFDGIYSGFLGSKEQVAIVMDTHRRYKKAGTIAVIDPVMADDGKLYSLFDMDFVRTMAKLVPLADYLVPNITEASLLTGIEYKEGPYSEDYIKSLIEKLVQMGAKNVVLTGVYLKEGHLGAAYLDEGGKICYYFSDRIEGYYHGTGDVFGSVLSAELVNGKTVGEATRSAVDFVVSAIKATPKDADKKYGVDFETVLKGNR